MIADKCAEPIVPLAKALLQSTFGIEQHDLRSPEGLRFHEINPVFRLVNFPLSGIELEFHINLLADSR